MPFTLTMPKLSPTMELGLIVKWHKKVGDFINTGDLILEVATDKATVEYEALNEGWLRQILVQEGQDASVNQPIAILSEEENESLEGYQPEGVATIKEMATSGQKEEEKLVEKETETREQPKRAGLEQPIFIPEAPLANYQFEYPTEELKGRLLASPLARKLAKEKNLDLSGIKGSGPRGRIIARDLERAEPIGLANFDKRELPTLPPGSYEEKPLTPMRKVIGQRLQEAKTFIPHFYVSQVINAKPLSDIRMQLNYHAIKLSINDFIIKACAFALKKHPTINSGFNSAKQAIVQFKTIDISIAVGMEEGLITPILRHADYKNISQLSREIKSLAKRAREGKLSSDEYKGGSFTISNLGMFGITDFQAIINPPQAAILAVSGIQEVPIVSNGQIIPGQTMHLTLSVDHRVIDGMEAAKFLQTLKELLEQPAILLL